MSLNVLTYNQALEEAKKYTDQKINEIIQKYLTNKYTDEESSEQIVVDTNSNKQ